MGFRFRRSIRLAPGIRLNVSKPGISTSLGPRGAHVTLGNGQVRETVGIPGTGLSYSETHRITEPGTAAESESGSPGKGAKIAPAVRLLIIVAVVVILYLLS